MATDAAKKNAKKANLLDHHSIKHLLDESVTEVVTSRGYKENVRLSNIKLLLGLVIIAIALVAQFYWKKFPENKNFLIGCIILYPFSSMMNFKGPTLFYLLASLQHAFRSFERNIEIFILKCLYVVVNGLLQLIIHTKEKNAILFTHPLEGSFTSTGLVVSSKLPRFSDLYTLTIASADPESISANKPVEFTKSVTKWFTKDGVLVEGLFWKDVEGLLDRIGQLT
uniref:Signal peptidase complex subunit 2 n=1 Tax=Kalanchoe fedtschenkoi TaxID=63787 RepID=A0A7N0R8E0_KALFE